MASEIVFLVLSWLGTYLVHSTLLLGAVWLLSKRGLLRAPRLAERTWRFAVVGGVCAAAYAFIHPLETLKNCAQAGLPRPRASLAERVQYLGGPRGLYRGALPSILCGGLRNGCATVAMNGFANPLITRLGLRET